MRAAELRRWVDSGDYTRILAGDYPRRDDDDTATVTDAAREAADSYTETFRQSQDAVGKAGPRRGRVRRQRQDSGSTSMRRNRDE